jgi:hypothetical protein
MQGFFSRLIFRQDIGALLFDKNVSQFPDSTGILSESTVAP